jgi:hypothetical protein
MKKNEVELKKQFDNLAESERLHWLRRLDPKLKRQAKKQFNLSFGTEEDDEDDYDFSDDDEDVQLTEQEKQNVRIQEEKAEQQA